MLYHLLLRSPITDRVWNGRMSVVTIAGFMVTGDGYLINSGKLQLEFKVFLNVTDCGA